MLALPSPPELSERMPGKLRNTSATERGANCSMASWPRLETEIEVSSLFVPLATAVTTISLASTSSAAGASCAKAELDSAIAATDASNVIE